MTTRFPEPTETVRSAVDRRIACFVCGASATIEYKITYDFLSGIVSYAYALACETHKDVAKARLTEWSRDMAVVDAIRRGV